ncbi:MAG: Rieske 2Fe-2S domain-containing protein [Acidimicrobiaceae bacterium]|nr:Rieske 2Fe-2S domain-containing protein [Acidimicrobiaceae bacterium]
MSTDRLSPVERRAERVALGLLVLSALAAIGVSIAYWWTANIQLLGGLLGATFLLLAAGLVVWSHHLLPEGPYEEPYPQLSSPEEEQAEVLAAADRTGIGRRRVLVGTLGVIGGALTVGVASSLRSLGPAPFAFAGTPWRGHRQLVTSDGTPIDSRLIPVNGIITAFPAGFPNSPAAPALLIHLPPGVNHPLPGRAGWAPDGFVCYSKVCTHAGCAVSLYNAERFELQCPCHQSTFDVTRGAKPVFGPAAGPLPQLPIAVAADATLRSTGELSGPPGPVYWHHS